MGSDSEKNREKYLAMLKIALEEARAGSRREEFRSVPRFLIARENCSEEGTTGECRKAIPQRTAKRTRSEELAGSEVIAAQSWSQRSRRAGIAAA